MVVQSLACITCRNVHRATGRSLRSVSSLLNPQQAGEKAQQIAQKRGGKPRRSIDTVLSHAGVLPTTNSLAQTSTSAPLSPPLHLATTYTRPASGLYGEHDSKYTRNDNPTRLLFESEMTRFELPKDDKDDNYDANDSNTDNDDRLSYSCAFSSGMMAASAIILAHRAPLLVLLPTDVYHGVPSVLTDVFARFHVTTRKVDMQQVESILKVYEATGTDIVLWMESPSNPQTQVVDIESICALVKTMRNASSITTVVDSTLAPFQRPLLLGADLALHSATKYIGGHSDVLCGVVTVHPSRAQDLLPRLRTVQTGVGGVASPMDCWLALRGMRTLSLRYQRQSESALRVAHYLDGHEAVWKVHYPGLPTHPQHDIAKKQMKGGKFGGVLSVEMRTEAHAMAFAGALQIVARATSLGGTETLIEHRASIEPEGRVVSPVGLLRISLGLEEADDLIADMREALLIMNEVCD
jgi:cystathionine gamma-synthase